MCFYDVVCVLVCMTVLCCMADDVLFVVVFLCVLVYCIVVCFSVMYYGVGSCVSVVFVVLYRVIMDGLNVHAVPTTT